MPHLSHGWTVFFTGAGWITGVSASREKFVRSMGISYTELRSWFRSRLRSTPRKSEREKSAPKMSIVLFDGKLGNLVYSSSDSGRSATEGEEEREGARAGTRVGTVRE